MYTHIVGLHGGSPEVSALSRKHYISFYMIWLLHTFIDIHIYIYIYIYRYYTYVCIQCTCIRSYVRCFNDAGKVNKIETPPFLVRLLSGAKSCAPELTKV